MHTQEIREGMATIVPPEWDRTGVRLTRCPQTATLNPLPPLMSLSVLGQGRGVLAMLSALDLMAWFAISNASWV